MATAKQSKKNPGLMHGMAKAAPDESHKSGCLDGRQLRHRITIHLVFGLAHPASGIIYPMHFRASMQVRNTGGDRSQKHLEIAFLPLPVSTFNFPRGKKLYELVGAWW